MRTKLIEGDLKVDFKPLLSGRSPMDKSRLVVARVTKVSTTKDHKVYCQAVIEETEDNNWRDPVHAVIGETVLIYQENGVTFDYDINRVRGFQPFAVRIGRDEPRQVSLAAGQRLLVLAYRHQKGLRAYRWANYFDAISLLDDLRADGMYRIVFVATPDPGRAIMGGSLSKKIYCGADEFNTVYDRCMMTRRGQNVEIDELTESGWKPVVLSRFNMD